jgi:hypothetical protein
MFDIVCQQLCEVVARYGRSVYEDRSRCAGLLRDFCQGQYKLEVAVLLNALDEGVAAELLASSEAMPKEMVLARLTKRLEENQGLRADIARWAVESWGLALGKLAAQELNSSSTAAASVTPHAVLSGMSTPGVAAPNGITKVDSVGAVQAAMHTSPSPRSIPHVSPLPPVSPEAIKMNVLLLGLLLVVTFGIYSGVWFLKGKAYLNTLRSAKRIGPAPVFYIVMSSLALAFSCTGGAVETSDPDAAAGFYGFYLLAALLATITQLVLSFRVRRMLDEHFNIYLGKGIKFSKVLTFFFNNLYLQYKLNRLPAQP